MKHSSFRFEQSSRDAEFCEDQGRCGLEALEKWAGFGGRLLWLDL